jgi:hypothetical protein
VTRSRVLVAVVGVSLALALPSYAQRESHLTRYGLSITLPARWHGTIYRRVGGLPVLHAGNIRLPNGDDDPGTKAIKKMGRSSVLIVLLESRGAGGVTWRKLSRPPKVRRSDFLPRFKGVPPSHAFARVLFRTSGRYFQLWVQFGTRPAPARLLRDANSVVSTLTIAPAKPAPRRHLPSFRRGRERGAFVSGWRSGSRIAG